MKPAPRPKDVRSRIRDFLEEYPLDRYGAPTDGQPRPSDAGQIMALQKAQHHILSLVLEMDPDLLERYLNLLLHHTDLSEDVLVAARNDLGLCNPICGPISLNSTQKPDGLALERLVPRESRNAVKNVVDNFIPNSETGGK